ncbi:MAG: Hsp70 family protein [Calditrichia bacterium]
MAEKMTHVLGIDFGTANSYFCKFLLDPDGHKIRTIDFGNNQLGSVSTTILYRDGKEPLVGTIAEEEWGDASSAERKGYRIRTHFKPDIVVSPEARADAVEFLRTIKEQTGRRRIDFAEKGQQVVVGIPGEADAAYQEALSTIFRDAGYGGTRLIAEPVGALLYHLYNHDISPAEAQRGVLVVDFGGGTCDFAFMQRLEVYKAWGDMLLGGRLFDDLFFQWFLEQNPDALKKLHKQGDEYYVHWFECRRIKEFFSETMLLDRTESVRAKLGQMQNYGTFRDLKWDEFEHRARNYTPHPTFISYMKQRHVKANRLLEAKNLDLFDWFQTTLLDGMERNNIKPGDIQQVILTGGSSQWLFVKDIVCETLKIDEKRLLTSENPKAAISEGLVVLPSLQKKFERISSTLRKDLPGFFEARIEPAVNKRIGEVISHILKDISTRLYDGEISPLLYQFREEGGSIEQLRRKLSLVMAKFEPAMKQIIEKNLLDLNTILPQLLHEEVTKWFSENSISYFGEKADARAVAPLYRQGSVSSGPQEATRLYDEMMNLIGGFVIVITASIVAGISGGGGTALIMSGPIGIVVGALAAVAVGFLALEVGKEEARDMVEKIEIPSAVTRLMLREGKIRSVLSEGKEKLEVQLRGEIEKAVQMPFAEIRKKIVANIKREIDGLSLINQL